MAKISIPITNKDNFYARRLSGAAYALYSDCVENLSQGVLQGSAQMEMTQANQQVVEEVVRALFCGVPELFYVSQQVQMQWGASGVRIEFNNKYEGQDIGVLWAQLTGEIKRIADKIRLIPDTYDKLHRLNKYLCVRVNPRGSYVDSCGDAYGALILKSARCEGFAKAAKLILDAVGIPAMLAAGEATLEGQTAENHAWNIVWCNNTPYHFDFTWNASRGLYGLPSPEYLFLTDKDIYLDHKPWYTYPVCTDDSQTHWAKNGGIVRYHSDLSRIKIFPVKNHYMAVAKLLYTPTEYEVNNEVFAWMKDELAAYTYGSRVDYTYNKNLNVFVFYFLND